MWFPPWSTGYRFNFGVSTSCLAALRKLWVSPRSWAFQPPLRLVLLLMSSTQSRELTTMWTRVEWCLTVWLLFVSIKTQITVLHLKKNTKSVIVSSLLCCRSVSQQENKYRFNILLRSDPGGDVCVCVCVCVCARLTPHSPAPVSISSVGLIHDSRTSRGLTSSKPLKARFVARVMASLTPLGIIWWVNDPITRWSIRWSGPFYEDTQRKDPVSYNIKQASSCPLLSFVSLSDSFPSCQGEYRRRIYQTPIPDSAWNDWFKAKVSMLATGLPISDKSISRHPTLPSLMGWQLIWWETDAVWFILASQVHTESSLDKTPKLPRKVFLPTSRLRSVKWCWWCRRLQGAALPPRRYWQSFSGGDAFRYPFVFSWQRMLPLLLPRCSWDGSWSRMFASASHIPTGVFVSMHTRWRQKMCAGVGFSWKPLAGGGEGMEDVHRDAEAPTTCTARETRERQCMFYVFNAQRNAPITYKVALQQCRKTLCVVWHAALRKRDFILLDLGWINEYLVFKRFLMFISL